MKNQILLWMLLLSSSGFAQGKLKGTIYKKTDAGKLETLPGASVNWKGTKIGDAADVDGKFSIKYPDSLPALLITRFVGLQNDTLLVQERLDEGIKIVLQNIFTLSEVKVEERVQSTNVSTLTPINTEIISSKELLKAACCNLSESFETNASVDVNFTDAVSGAKQIQMLGLDGIYTQILGENVPLIRGLSSSYGLNYIPGTWVESILITKGAGSVANGYESITGQIQVEMLEPDKADKLFVNLYGANNSRAEANVHLAHRLNENSSTLLFLHASDLSMKTDMNKDGFLDMPLTRQYNVFNRWHFTNNKRLEGQLGLRALYENRQGGQISMTDNSGHTTGHQSISNQLYNIGIDTRQYEVFTKTGLLFPDKPYKSMALITSTRYHSQNSLFGITGYSGEQRSFNMSGIYQTATPDEKHKIKFGPSLIIDDYKETFIDSSFKRTEIVPGIYTEYTLIENKDKVYSLVAGARGDYHNLYGLIFTPRIHFKYNFSLLTALRLSGGRGFRTSNIFVENASIFASSRQVVIQERLLPESAWNFGISFTHKFKLFDREASFNTDFFRTDFENQVIVDLEDVNKIKFYNLKGVSYSNSFQTDINFQPVERLDVRLAYKNYDVRSTYSGNLLSKPLVAKDRLLFNIAYATNFEKWKFDYTLKWFDKSRLPDTSKNTDEYRLSNKSEEYYVMNAQVTKAFKHIQFYLGAENFLNYTQKSPILASEDPFGENFDASMIWGPVNGITVYGGLRYTLK